MSSGRSSGCWRGRSSPGTLTPPVEKDKGGTGEAMTAQLKWNPLFYPRNLRVLNSLRKPPGRLAKLRLGIGSQYSVSSFSPVKPYFRQWLRIGYQTSEIIYEETSEVLITSAKLLLVLRHQEVLVKHIGLTARLVSAALFQMGNPYIYIYI